MLQDELRAVESALLSVASARKYVQFYPANNASVEDSLNDLVSVLNDLFAPRTDLAEKDREPAANVPAAPAIAPDGLLLGVERDIFTYGDEEVCAANSAVRKLAGDVYRMGVKRIHFLPKVDAGELRRFFEILSLQSQDIEDLGGLSKALESRGVSEVVLGLSEKLSLVDRDDLPEEMDVVAYLRGRQALRHSPLSTDTAYDLPEDETEDVSDISDFFLDIAKGSQEKRRYLFNTLGNPARLAEALTLISQADPARYDDSATLPSPGILRDSLHAIASAIDTYPDEVRDTFVRNMGEAILSTDARSREMSIGGPLAADIGCGNAEDAVLAALPNDEIVQALSQHVRFHNGTANTISNFLEEFSADPKRKRAIRRMLARVSAGAEEERLREVVRLLDSKEVTPADEDPSDVETAPAIDYNQRSMLARKLFMDDDELESVQRGVVSSYRTETSEHAARTLFELFTCLSIDTFSQPTLDNLSAQLSKILEAGNYAFLAELLPLAVNDLPSDAQARVRSCIAPILSECSFPKHVDNLLAECRKAERPSIEYDQLLNLLGILGDQAADHLFLKLEMEQNRAMRLFLISLCVDLGERMLPTLRKKIVHRDWFVVRNAVHILGKMASDFAVDSLIELLHHRDARVQREVLRALGAVGGKRAEQILIRALDHEDPMVRRLAAEWLGRMGSERALSIFTDMITHEHRKLLKDMQLAVGLVTALGFLGTDEHIPLIQKIAPRAVMFGAHGKRDLADACADALLRLKGESVLVARRKRKSSKRGL